MVEVKGIARRDGEVAAGCRLRNDEAMRLNSLRLA